MNAEKDYIVVIKNIVEQNKRYLGNEDLLDLICEETLKRTKSVISLLQDEEKINDYITRVSNSAIIKVLKESGRLGRTTVRSVSASTTIFNNQNQVFVPNEQPIQSVVENIPQEIHNNINEPVEPIQEEDTIQFSPTEPEEEIAQEPVTVIEQLEQINEQLIESNEETYSDAAVIEQNDDILENMASALHVLNSQEPLKQYYLLYKLRYIDNMKNKDIAVNLNISQGEVTSRLLELSDKLKSCYKS